MNIDMRDADVPVLVRCQWLLEPRPLPARPGSPMPQPAGVAQYSEVGLTAATSVSVIIYVSRRYSSTGMEIQERLLFPIL